ncbi:MAG: hypothetical protein CMF42_03425 [Legionellales bacterium]|nr:hypothetical protein [Legionellales bacterium]
MSKYIVYAFYQFLPVDDVVDLQRRLEQWRNHQDLKGTIICAKEGINGTVAALPETIHTLRSWFVSETDFHHLEAKQHGCDENPFLRFKIKIKDEIVTLGAKNVKPIEQVGTYIEPEQWDTLIDDPDTIVIDTRNQYEIAIGTFKNAINPETDTFRDFKSYVKSHLDVKKNKKVAMYCTGGIRCEKASSWMLQEGFETVFHLKGGILNYLEKVKPEHSSWEGDCFVFDQRVAVNHQCEAGEYTQCYACRMPLTKQQLQHPHYEPGISCEYCIHTTSPEQKAAFKERQHQQTLAKKRGEQHIGAKS